MTLSVYAVAVPLMTQMLKGMARSLEKGAAFAEAKQIEPAVLLNARLAPDQFALLRQVQVVTDNAKGGAARLANREVPSYPDMETTFPELQARIARTLEFIGAIPETEYEGAEHRTIELKMRARTMSFSGQNYLLNFLIPNLIFHATTAYQILRHNGVDLGKLDFMNAPATLS